MMMLYILAAAVCMTSPAPQGIGATTPRKAFARDARHPISVGIEASRNGLVGLGGVVGYTLNRFFTMEGGAGYSDAGLKVGTRLRYHPFHGDFSPFAALGFSVASGTWGDTVEVTDDADELPARYSISASPYAQAVLGLRQRIDRFEFSVMAGWSQLLREKNITWAAAPTEFQKRTYPGRVDSGFVLAMNASYTF